MERIDFVNGETKGNETTFEKLQDNIENAIAPNIMTVALTVNQHLGTKGQPVVFNQLLQNLGDKLTFENGAIKIGKGVNHIKASCNLWVEALGDSYSVVVLQRKRNSSEYSISRSMLPKSTYIGESWRTHSIPPTLIDVQEGDIIQCQVIFNIDNEYNCVSGIYENCSTMQVEVVD